MNKDNKRTKELLTGSNSEPKIGIALSYQEVVETVVSLLRGWYICPPDIACEDKVCADRGAYKGCTHEETIACFTKVVLKMTREELIKCLKETR